MGIYRKWYCTCSGIPVELPLAPPLLDDEPDEQACELCGATPSSDPKQSVIYRDVEDWED